MRLLGTLLVAAALLLGAAACGGGGGGNGGGENAGGEGGSGEVPREVVGVLTDFERDGPGVKSLTIREDDGTTRTIVLDPDIDYGITTETFEQLKASESPILVAVEDRNGQLYATVILNA